MTEILSQNEIDNLLDNISSGSVDSGESENKKSGGSKIIIYDFQRPNLLSKDQLRNLEIIHENFARLVSISITKELQLFTLLHVASVDVITFEEFIRSIPNPTTLATFKLPPLHGQALLEIDPSISFSIIDRIQGGSGENYKYSRKITDIEKALMQELITNTVLPNFESAWAKYFDFKTELDKMETNPQFALIAHPNETCVIITLEVKIDIVEGQINLCLPYPLIQKVLKTLNTSIAIDTGNTLAKSIENKNNLKIKKETIFDIKNSFTFNNLCSLGKGDTILMPENLKTEKTYQVQ